MPSSNDGATLPPSPASLGKRSKAAGKTYDFLATAVLIIVETGVAEVNENFRLHADTAARSSKGQARSDHEMDPQMTLTEECCNRERQLEITVPNHVANVLTEDLHT